MDRFTKGFISGIIAGLVFNLISLLSGFMGMSKLPIAAWTAIIIYGRTPPFTPIEIFIALVGNVFFTGILGCIFAYLLLGINRTHIYFKGIVYSIGVWFSIYAVTALFKLEGTLSLDLYTVLSNVIMSIVFGTGLAYFLAVLSTARTSPATKPVTTEQVDSPDDENEND